MSSPISAKIVLLPGDGVGPEVVAEAVRVLEAVAQRSGHSFSFETLLIGGAAHDAHGEPLRAVDIETCRGADALLLGAVGGPKYDAVRPERGLLMLRKSLELFANLRPVSVLPALYPASPLKPELLDGVDIMVVRELTGGIYFGQPSHQTEDERGKVAVDTLVYHEFEIERVVRLAFEIARGRRKQVASVDKANVLQSSRMWRGMVDEIAKDYPDVAYQHVLVDSMAMHLITQPARFDVIVTENMFGDILTDEASVLSGSIGLLPSASLGPHQGSGRRLGLYEPIHGSAPDIAGQGKANPAGTILSAALLLRLSLGLEDEASAIEAAVKDAVEAGVRTGDIAKGGPVSSTSEFGDAVVARLSA